MFHGFVVLSRVVGPECDTTTWISDSAPMDWSPPTRPLHDLATALADSSSRRNQLGRTTTLTVDKLN